MPYLRRQSVFGKDKWDVIMVSKGSLSGRTAGTKGDVNWERLPEVGGRNEAFVEAGGRSVHSRTRGEMKHPYKVDERRGDR